MVGGCGISSLQRKKRKLESERAALNDLEQSMAGKLNVEVKRNKELNAQLLNKDEQLNKEIDMGSVTKNKMRFLLRVSKNLRRFRKSMHYWRIVRRKPRKFVFGRR